jgi:3-oxoacyl-[acyl-carrier-protein] synthase-1
MKRVVVTGMGIVSCLGNDVSAVARSLRNGTSGIRFKEIYRELGLRSHVAGAIDIDLEALIDRKALRFMPEAAGYAFVAMQQAVADSGLAPAAVSNPRTGIVAGSGGASAADQVEGTDTLRAKGVRRIGVYRVTQTMSSTVSACLATPFKIRGVNYSISSACATSAHCIGHAAELIQWGK